MSVIPTESILKKEFPNGLTENDKEVISRSAKIETTTTIKGKGLPKSTTLLKAYATSDTGAKRLVYLLRNTSGHLILLFYRDKKDKVGKNISIKNKYFENALLKYLSLVLADIENGNFTIL